MGEFDSIDKVLEFAIAREIEANQFYMELAGQMANPTMRQVFEEFAKEELGHKAKLEAMKTDRTMEPAKKVINLKIADYIVDGESGPNMEYQDALILAMQKEKASFRLYTDLAAEVENEDQQKIFLALAQEEAKHKLYFETEYDDVILQEN
jgi:rubrerythrin